MMSRFEQFFSRLETGNTLFIPGASAEPREFIESINKNYASLPEIECINSFVPGINPLPLAQRDNLITETTVFPRGFGVAEPHQINFQPISYFAFSKYLERRSIDWACIQVSPPDGHGNCCLGPSIEFLPIVLNRSRHILGLINPNLPHIKGAPTIPFRNFTMTVDINSPLVTYQPNGVDDASQAISEYLATLIEPGAVLQLGLGNVPSQLSNNLCKLRKLRFHSGMLSDGFIKLIKAGAIDPDHINKTCCALGSSEFYKELNDLDQFQISGVNQTHAPDAFLNLQDFIAINSALEVDLWGQANLEMINHRQISSVGGAADFARAAHNSTQGKSIIALPATAADGKISRICAQFPPGQVTSLSRNEIDYVVTEYGIARLKDRSITQRGNALINVSAPQFRETLSKEWREVSKTL